MKVIKSQIRSPNDKIASTLSGGLDSSSVSLIVNKNKNQYSLNTFSVHFNGLSKSDFEKTNELTYVEDVIKKIDSHHTFIQLGYKKDGPILILNPEIIVITCHLQL